MLHAFSLEFQISLSHGSSLLKAIFNFGISTWATTFTVSHLIITSNIYTNILYYRKVRCSLLMAVDGLLKNCHPMDSTVLPARLAKTALPSVMKIMSTSASAAAGTQEGPLSKSKSSKKRARNFEGDEVFKSTRDVVCSSKDECDVLLISLDGMLHTVPYFFDNLTYHLNPQFCSVF